MTTSRSCCGRRPRLLHGPGQGVRAFQRGDDPLQAAEGLEGVQGLVVGDRRRSGRAPSPSGRRARGRRRGSPGRRRSSALRGSGRRHPAGRRTWSRAARPTLPAPRAAACLPVPMPLAGGLHPDQLDRRRP
ncbi:MAG: hypothetical protein MZV70_57895 [Desulfobacterales bacterium]|nr:hypothetical protein [Desulfobacterales bacterium]